MMGMRRSMVPRAIVPAGARLSVLPFAPPPEDGKDR